MPRIKKKKATTRALHKSQLGFAQPDLSFAAIYRVEPMDRIKLIRDGIPARYINVISDSMGITKETLFKFLN